MMGEDVWDDGGMSGMMEGACLGWWGDVLDDGGRCLGCWGRMSGMMRGCLGG